MTTCPRCGKTNAAEIHTCSPQKPPPSGESHEDSLKSGEQARALVLADELVRCYHAGVGGPDLQAADELRRLHAELDKVKQITLRDEALLRRALRALVGSLENPNWAVAHGDTVAAIAALKERLKGKT
jgi:hypothetical protein